ncbi:MAG: sensor histidine kinase [Spirochaetia bacterium]|nr:sensor histidine kinase [Spirochaetia bacterium]
MIGVSRREPSKQILALVLISIFTGFCGPAHSRKAPPAAVAGTLDLRDWNFETDGPVELKGQWEFYWNKFKSDISANDSPGLIEPGAWHTFKHEGKEVGAMGYATYHLRILLPASRSNLALKTGGYDSAARLTLAGVEHSIGKPGRTRRETEPIYRQDLLEIPETGEKIDFYIETSNFFHKSGGMLAAPVIGPSKIMHAVLLHSQIWQAILAGIFLIFGIYHLLLHVIRRNYVALYFGSYCLLMSARTLLTGEEIIHTWLPELDLRLDLFLEYLGLFLIAPVFALFLRALFPDEFPKWMRNAFLIVGSIFLLSLVLPPETGSHFAGVYSVVVLSTVIAGMAAAIRAIYKQRSGARIFLLGFASLAVGVVLDVVVSLSTSTSAAFSSVGMIGFVLAQAIVIANRFSAALSESERLSSSLQIAYSEAVDLRGKLAQKEKMATIGDMAAGIVHDLKNPVGIIKGSVEMADDDSIKKDTRRQLLDIINKEADRMLYLAQDLLDFSQGVVSVKQQETDLSVYAQRIRQVLAPNFREKNIGFSLNLSANGNVNLDADRFLRVLVNISSNAADALPRGGTFDISIQRQAHQVVFTLRDNGPGIPESIQESLFQPFVTHGKSHGTGLGMAIAKSIVDAHAGIISFTTQSGKGTTFTIEVPA